MSQHVSYFLSDEEFLRTIIRQRFQSPLIEELCRRLELKLEEEIPTFQENLDVAAMTLETLDGKNISLICPTCDAHLTISICPELETVELKHKSKI